jgi:ubiquinone/menaquinone biosynthesis C-methylase UbiE
MYLMESQLEAERLDAKTDDASTRQLLVSAGVSAGQRVLDAGAGSGAVSRLICDLVGPSGEVVALEQSPDRAEFIRQRAIRESISNLRIVEGDLHQPPLEPESFDVVWSQFVFEYLADPQPAARTIAGLLRPGGKLAIADIDGYAMFHYPVPEAVEQGLALLANGIGRHFDPFVGRKLYHIVRTAGLRDVRVHMHPHHFYAGAVAPRELEFWKFKCDTIRPIATRLFGGEPAYDSWADAFLEMLRDPDRFSYSVLFLVEGIK